MLINAVQWHRSCDATDPGGRTRMHHGCYLLQPYALDFTTLAAIELAVFAVLEFKRYEGYKKTGEVR
jgi:hypothetical protein